ncbi:MAG TPA: ABC transporter ATP-binding protein [Puia sp.]|nr:ABC transporter ATP-binding protein [Puia sp.]
MSGILETNHLQKFFYEPEPFQVLRDVTLCVQKGEFVALVGKSGSGKSTLLYLLSTMDTDFQGSIVIDGKTVAGKSQNELARFRNERLGFVFQFHYLLPEFTALENVLLPARRLGRYPLAEIRARAIEKLGQVGMESFADKLSGKLSGGQQQRVAITRALINDPVLVLADEPTGNLDSMNSKVVLDIFQELSRRNGQTIVAVTHDLDFARHADRIVEIADGRIVS